MNETVKENCKHKDCVYRGTFNFRPCCDYILLEHKPRGCSISECKRYKPGTRKRVSEFYYLTSEIEDDV